MDKTKHGNEFSQIEFTLYTAHCNKNLSEALILRSNHSCTCIFFGAQSEGIGSGVALVPPDPPSLGKKKLQRDHNLAVTGVPGTL